MFVLARLADLEYVELVHTNVASLSALVSCPRLKSLDISYMHHLRHLSPLAQCHNLVQLRLENTSIGYTPGGIGSLASCMALRALFFTLGKDSILYGCLRAEMRVMMRGGWADEVAAGNGGVEKARWTREGPEGGGGNPGT